MSNEIRNVQGRIYATGTICQASRDQVARPRKRNLGGAIFLAAIDDYRGMDEQAHKDAEQFLYPKTAERQEHYDWAVAVAGAVNPAWLRDVLDRFKAKWDWQRFEHKALRNRTASESTHNKGERNEGNRCGERIRSDRHGVPYWSA